MIILMTLLILGLLIGVFLLATSKVEVDENDEEITSLNSRFDKVEEVIVPLKVLVTADFIKKLEPLPHVEEMKSTSKKHLQKNNRKPVAKLKTI